MRGQEDRKAVCGAMRSVSLHRSARYHVITLMKWMFTYAAICFIPFSYHDFAVTDLTAFPLRVWAEAGYVIFFGTYVAYILMLVGQKALRPTVVSMYNYMQPVVGSSVSVAVGMATFGWVKAVAAVCIFVGVYLSLIHILTLPTICSV